MHIRRNIILGCLVGASLFVGCNRNQQPAAEEKVSEETAEQSQEKELEMYEASELAELMNSIYERNLALGEDIEAGNIPESFPEDFYKIHTAEATPGMLHDTAFFNNMAQQYLANMKKITEAETKEEAKIAYNDMIMTCASCHQVYCQGPLPKIKKMKLSMIEADE